MTPQQYTIIDSARRHGITDQQISHAMRNPITISVTNDDLTMIVGHDGRSALIEVGFVESDHRITIIHAMHARPRTLR